MVHPLGKHGEDFAEKCLKNDGFQILARNFQRRGFEIDLIARKNNRIYFFEVKTYSALSRVSAEEKITPPKIKKLIKGAQFFLLTQPRQEWGCLFELLKITIIDKKQKMIRVPILID
jgi:putative endonuclease